MELTVRGLSFKAGNRSDDVPLTVTLLRELPGPDRPDYWLGELRQSLVWVSETDETFEISHLVLASQWEGTAIHAGVKRVPVGVAYVTDPSLLEDDRLDIEKIRYVATGVADDTTGMDVDATPMKAASGTSMMGRVAAKLFGKRAGEEPAGSDTGDKPEGEA